MLTEDEVKKPAENSASDSPPAKQKEESVTTAVAKRPAAKARAKPRAKTAKAKAAAKKPAARAKSARRRGYPLEAKLHTNGENKHRAGTIRHKNYERAQSSKTVGDYVKRGGTLSQVTRMVRRKEATVSE